MMKIFIYYRLKRGGFKPQFFGKDCYSECTRINIPFVQTFYVFAPV